MAMAIGKSGDVALFTAALELFDALCVGSKIPAFATLAKTLRGWRTEIVNYAASGGASNGFAEAIIHLIKNQKRQAHGYRTWAGFRGQILWAFGEVVDPGTGEITAIWSSPTAADGRRRRPRTPAAREAVACPGRRLRSTYSSAWDRRDA